MNPLWPYISKNRGTGFKNLTRNVPLLL